MQKEFSTHLLHTLCMGNTEIAEVKRKINLESSVLLECLMWDTQNLQAYKSNILTVLNPISYHLTLKELKFQKCVFEAFGRDLDFLLISLLARFRQFPSYAVLHLNCKRRPGPEVMLCKCCLLPFLDMVSNDLPKITYAVFCQAQS